MNFQATGSLRGIAILFVFASINLTYAKETKTEKDLVNSCVQSLTEKVSNNELDQTSKQTLQDNLTFNLSQVEAKGKCEAYLSNKKPEELVKRTVSRCMINSMLKLGRDDRASDCLILRNQDNNTPPIPDLLFSRNSDQARAKKCLDDTLHECMQKHFSPNQFIADLKKEQIPNLGCHLDGTEVVEVSCSRGKKVEKDGEDQETFSQDSPYFSCTLPKSDYEQINLADVYKDPKNTSGSCKKGLTFGIANQKVWATSECQGKLRARIYNPTCGLRSVCSPEAKEKNFEEEESYKNKACSKGVIQATNFQQLFFAEGSPACTLTDLGVSICDIRKIKPKKGELQLGDPKFDPRNFVSTLAKGKEEAQKGSPLKDKLITLKEGLYGLYYKGKRENKDACKPGVDYGLIGQNIFWYSPEKCPITTQSSNLNFAFHTDLCQKRCVFAGEKADNKGLCCQGLFYNEGDGKCHAPVNIPSPESIELENPAEKCKTKISKDERKKYKLIEAKLETFSNLFTHTDSKLWNYAENLKNPMGDLIVNMYREVSKRNKDLAEAYANYRKVIEIINTDFREYVEGLKSPNKKELIADPEFQKNSFFGLNEQDAAAVANKRGEEARLVLFKNIVTVHQDFHANIIPLTQLSYDAAWFCAHESECMPYFWDVGNPEDKRRKHSHYRFFPIVTTSPLSHPFQEGRSNLSKSQDEDHLAAFFKDPNFSKKVAGMKENEQIPQGNSLAAEYFDLWTKPHKYLCEKNTVIRAKPKEGEESKEEVEGKLTQVPIGPALIFSELESLVQLSILYYEAQHSIAKRAIGCVANTAQDSIIENKANGSRSSAATDRSLAETNFKNRLEEEGLEEQAEVTARESTDEGQQDFTSRFRGQGFFASQNLFGDAKRAATNNNSFGGGGSVQANGGQNASGIGRNNNLSSGAEKQRERLQERAENFKQVFPTGSPNVGLVASVQKSNQAGEGANEFQLARGGSGRLGGGGSLGARSGGQGASRAGNSQASSPSSSSTFAKIEKKNKPLEIKPLSFNNNGSKSRKTRRRSSSRSSSRRRSSSSSKSKSKVQDVTQSSEKSSSAFRSGRRAASTGRQGTQAKDVTENVDLTSDINLPPLDEADVRTIIENIRQRDTTVEEDDEVFMKIRKTYIRHYHELLPSVD